MLFVGAAYPACASACASSSQREYRARGRAGWSLNLTQTSSGFQAGEPVPWKTLGHHAREVHPGYQGSPHNKESSGQKRSMRLRTELRSSPCDASY